MKEFLYLLDDVRWVGITGVLHEVEKFAEQLTPVREASSGAIDSVHGRAGADEQDAAAVRNGFEERGR
jgi:hypothetical protein